MSRIARIVVPHASHHITTRGNRREQVFFCDGDYQLYLDLLFQACGREGLVIEAYCLMPNHIHLVVRPAHEDSLWRAIGEVNRRYTAIINTRYSWTGHLFQSRFASFPMDDTHRVHAIRYVHNNPVRARLGDTAKDWPWSSAHLQTAALDHVLTDDELQQEELAIRHIRQNSRTGRPLGTEDWVKSLEASTGRRLRPLPTGPKRHAPDPSAELVGVSKREATSLTSEDPTTNIPGTPKDDAAADTAVPTAPLHADESATPAPDDSAADTPGPRSG